MERWIRMGFVVICLACALGLFLAPSYSDPAETSVPEIVGQPVDGVERPVEPAAPRTSPGACGQDTEAEVLASLDVAAARTGGPPPCPLVSSCGGDTIIPCSGLLKCQGASGPPTLTDTGWTSCDDGGRIVTCDEGETIKIKSKACVQCPCCSDPNPCLCPNDCGISQNWQCM
jgi:hypothetical protein